MHSEPLEKPTSQATNQWNKQIKKKVSPPTSLSLDTKRIRACYFGPSCKPCSLQRSIIWVGWPCYRYLFLIKLDIMDQGCFSAFIPLSQKIQLRICHGAKHPINVCWERELTSERSKEVPVGHLARQIRSFLLLELGKTQRLKSWGHSNEINICLTKL